MKTLKKYVYKWLEKWFLDGCSHYNTLEVRRKSRRKSQAREVFKKLGVPHAKGVVYFLPFKPLAFIKKYGFPIVLKPNLGGYSRGSYFPINNYKDFWKAFFLTKIWWPMTVIEQYLEGHNYRVVVTKDGTEIVMERFPAFVIGDGQKTLSQLIDEENTIRSEMKLLPIIHHIEKNKQTAKHIKKYFRYSFESVPKKDQKVTLFHRVALSPGGVLKDVPVNTISQKNKQLFQSILDEFGANIFGIDVIMKDGIEKDYDQQACIFLELNSRPYLKMHNYLRWGKKPNMEALYKKLDAIEIHNKELF